MATSSPLISVKDAGKGTLQVTVEAADFLGLLSVITGLFASYDIHIIRGRIGTHNKKAIDVFEVISAHPIEWKKVEEDLASRRAARRARRHR